MKRNSKSLWNFYDDEPFMENPQLGILGAVNPKRRTKRGKKMAVRRRRRVTRRRGRKATTRRRRTSSAPVRRRRHVRSAPKRRRRRNWAVSGVVTPILGNPRRRRRGRRATVRSHRRRRSNPLLGGLPSIKSVAFAGIGFAGPSIVTGFLTSYAPSVMQMTSNLGIAGKYVTRIGSVLGLSWLTKRFVGQNEANMVLIGGAVNILMTAVNDFVPGILPVNPLAMYVPTNPGHPQLRQYTPLRGLGGRITTPMVMAQDRGARPFGGTAVRFKRF
jgi:hypothetical protein